MNKRICTVILCLSALFSAMSSSELAQLELALADRTKYVSAKESRIDSIKRTLTSGSGVEQRLKCYDELYREYLTFRFDSAIRYLDLSDMLIGAEADYSAKSLLKVHRALSLATSGHFSEAVDLLRTIDSALLSENAKREFYEAMQWTYGAWGEYSGQTVFAARYYDLSITYIDSLLMVTDKHTPEYDYYFADKALRLGEFETARDNYIRALETTPPSTRLYAQAAYGLAMSYRGMEKYDNYRQWLINAAISDQIIPLKENLALQELARDIRNRDGNLEAANRYLKYSLEDAIFYNNRLRMLEISEKFPDIALSYQDTITAQNRRLKFYVLLIGILLLGLVAAVWIIVREKKQIGKSRHELAQLNTQLLDLNNKLSRTNIRRQQYVSLFMDLCAAYIEKLNRFKSTVILKVKVKQYDDLLQVANNNARLSDAEMREVFFNFDTAFLRLYPDFIEKFNSLLRPDQRIYPKSNELLNTDLRIFALMRMGIKDSTKIATLLFFSTQTIFNHRTQVRNRAIKRDSFEQDLMDICAVLPNPA